MLWNIMKNLMEVKMLRSDNNNNKNWPENIILQTKLLPKNDLPILSCIDLRKTTYYSHIEINSFQPYLKVNFKAGKKNLWKIY